MTTPDTGATHAAATGEDRTAAGTGVPPEEAAARTAAPPDGPVAHFAPRPEEAVARTAPPPDEATALLAPRPEEAVARPGRRGPADPVRSLMHRHQELCARAVDALEIAAGLEAHGVTDRTAARFRHRDVFSLAEELYARVPRADPESAAPERADPGYADPESADPERAGHHGPGHPSVPVPARGSGGVRGVLQLLPGAVCVAALAAVASAGAAPPSVRVAVGAAGGVLLVLAVRLAVRSGPLRSRHRGAGPWTAGLWVCWTAGYAVYGDWLLEELLAGGPDLPHATPHAAAATAVALAFALAPAAGCARWFAARGRRGLAASRGLGELAARIRPLLLATTLLFLGALTALLLGADAAFGGVGRTAQAAAAALGVLLFLARLLTVHGFPEAAATGVAAAAALEALALSLVLIARLPGLPPLDVPVEALATAVGPAAVPAVACTAAAAGLLVYGLRALTGACAHRPAPSGPAEAQRP
ncbi:hypothetical protein AB0G60_35275 [Streptomyces angustmyceticus]|uniref:Integral membrane protein n=1 Tax=Streptomyces angustmyceticus TaxID=285578 RepID=A0A5J4L8H1_9ACTN|nr:hypothetical protein [Streptomyces angustmyceticus]GES30453.1 hypothetical protein San01_29400 [Streptomyces angustmyceticus]